MLNIKTKELKISDKLKILQVQMLLMLCHISLSLRIINT